MSGRSMNPRLPFIAAAALAVLAWAAASYAGEKKTLPPSDGGAARTSVSASGATASSGPRSDAAARKSGFASRAESRDAFARNLFERCRDARGGPSQRACEYEYAAKVINR